MAVTLVRRSTCASPSSRRGAEIPTVGVPTAAPAVTAEAGIRPHAAEEDIPPPAHAVEVDIPLPAHAVEVDIPPQVLGAEGVGRRTVVGARIAAVVRRRTAMAVAADTEGRRSNSHTLAISIETGTSPVSFLWCARQGALTWR
jgi:hypothetical protein